MLTLVVSGIEVHLAGAVLLGLLVGFIAGMFGVGGGFLLTPLLGIVFGLPMPIAVGTGMCQMVGSSTVGYLRHREEGRGEPRFAALLIVGSVLGVAAGADVVGALEALGQIRLLGHAVPIVELALLSAFVVFLLVVAGVLWRQGQGNYEPLEYVRRGPLARVALPPLVDLPAVPMRQVSAILIAYVGLGMGFISGMLGVGGGIALIPLLLYGFGFPFRQAAGTGAGVTLLTAIVGTVAHALAGHVHLGLAMTMLVGSGVSAQLGAMATARVPTRVLRRGLSVVVLVTAAVVLGRIAWDLA